MTKSEVTCRRHAAHKECSIYCLCAGLLLFAGSLLAGNFYAGTSPTNVPWPGGIVPYEFDTNTLTAVQQQTYLDGLREWEAGRECEIRSAYH